jgi:TolB protein
MNDLSSPARFLLAPALLLLSLSPAAAVAGDPPMYQLVGGKHPSWSPDSDRIVYDDPSNNGDIWTILADGWAPTNLTDHPAEDANADWSPTGNEIVFMSRGRVTGYPYQILRMPATGGEVEVLASGDPYYNNYPAWSPDGSQIVWERDTTGDGDSDLWVMPRTGNPETRSLSSMPLTRVPPGLPTAPRSLLHPSFAAAMPTSG